MNKKKQIKQSYFIPSQFSTVTQYENAFIKDWNENVVKAVSDILKYIAKETVRAIRIKSIDEFVDSDSEFIEKSHQEGDIHPNGKWVWTKTPSGYDWRVIKKKEIKEKAHWNEMKNSFNDKNEVYDWLYKIVKNKDLDPVESKNLILKFKKRYDFDSYDKAEKVLKGMAFQGNKFYRVEFNTSAGLYNFHIEKRNS